MFTTKCGKEIGTLVSLSPHKKILSNEEKLSLANRLLDFAKEIMGEDVPVSFGAGTHIQFTPDGSVPLGQYLFVHVGQGEHKQPLCVYGEVEGS